MATRIFDLEVALPRRRKTSYEALDWLQAELDVRHIDTPVIVPSTDFDPRPVAGSLTCGNTCGVLSIGCGGSGCGGVTCNCTQTCSCNCGDFTNGCDF